MRFYQLFPEDKLPNDVMNPDSNDICSNILIEGITDYNYNTSDDLHKRQYHPSRVSQYLRATLFKIEMTNNGTSIDNTQGNKLSKRGMSKPKPSPQKALLLSSPIFSLKTHQLEVLELFAIHHCGL